MLLAVVGCVPDNVAVYVQYVCVLWRKRRVAPPQEASVWRRVELHAF